MSKIYLGGSCSSEQRTLMTNIASALRKTKYEVFCPFELNIPNAWDMSQEQWSQKVFEKDLEEINKADIFLMITPGRISSAGTNWEQGYAYAKGKPVLVFQITEAPTSLMTYAGSSLFCNSTTRTVCGDILKILAGYDQYVALQKGPCSTTLT